MTTNELITALQRLEAESGSLVCLDCGYEHNCDIHGCAIIREAEDKLGDFNTVFNEDAVAAGHIQQACKIDAGGWADGGGGRWNGLTLR